MSTASLVDERAAIPVHVRMMRRVFSFPVLLAALLVVLAVLTVRSRFDDPDLWWHLKTGEIIWATHTIPTTDSFSYTTNHHAYIPHEWLSQVLIYGAYRAGGYRGLMLWLCFFTSSVLVAGYVLCSLYGGNTKVSFVGAVALWLFATVGFSIRPQMIGYFLLIVELLLLHLGRTRSARWFFGLPVLFAVWVNCHGSFFLGLILAGTILFASFFDFRLGSLVASAWNPRQRRMLMLALILSVVALCVNPIGVRQIFYPIDTMLHQPINLSAVQEWHPLQLTSIRGVALMAVLACIFLIAIVRRSELFWHELLILAMGTWLAVSHERMLFVFGILAAPILSRSLSTSWEGYNPEQDRPLVNAALLAASLGIAFLMFPSRQDLVRQVDQQSPAKAVEFIKSHHVSGRMLNEYVYGGYLIWAAPEHPVFIDGRADVFEWTGVLEAYGNWATLESDPNVLLDKYRIDFCLLTRQSPMARVLRLLPPWRVVYSDDQSIIFLRSAALSPAS
ncbi:MAG TPA: hypothetical protein VM554_03620 [Acidisarcina sp.]|nr:hypothetical protein [Acidisarcina sp.]